MPRVACVQISSTPDVNSNLELIEKLVGRAARDGAELVALPEAAEFIGADGEAFVEHARSVGDAPLRRLAELARREKLWLLVGSLSLQSGAKISNRSYLIDAEGQIVRHYDKIHLFDVTLPDGEEHRESSIYEAGSAAAVAPTPWGPVGLSICYDLRFPTLYRRMAQGGARIIFIPAAFTRTTGPLHWHTLVRARAIETGCYVIAPAQCGMHTPGRGSFGHSLIVDPWGRVLADGGEEVGIVAAVLEMDEVDRFRAAIPSPLLERPYTIEA